MATSSAEDPADPHWTLLPMRTATDVSAAFAVLSVLEELLHQGAPTFAPVALIATWGALFGAALGGSARPLARLSVRARTLSWCAGGALSGLVPALAIGAVPKLHGPHRAMALSSLAVGALGGAALGAYLSLSQPDRRGRAALDHRALAAAAVAVAFLATLALEVADATVLVLRVYPQVEAALVVVALACAGQAGIGVGRLLRRVVRDFARPWCSAAWLAVLLAGTLVSARVPEDAAARWLSWPIVARITAWARAVTDFDRDGASGWFGGGDCSPLDARIHPRAREIPGNGVDDNCRYGDARPRALASRDVQPPAAPPPVNVVVITIDALRADHVGSYGYGRPTTPHLDAFAKTARRFEHAYTSGGWTCLALQSMLSGLYPRRLDWAPVAVTTTERLVAFPWERSLRPGELFVNTLSAPVKWPLSPLPVWLRRRGMHTAAVVAFLPGTILRFGGWLDETFEHVTVAPKGDDSRVADAAVQLLSSMRGEPYFLWVHLFEPHDPYATHEGVPRFGSALVDEYDHDVAFADAQVGRILDAVSGSSEPTAVIVAADHGESFDGGVPAHGLDLHEESIRIPLLARGPGLSPGSSAALASLVDVAPTVLEWTGTPSPEGLDGTSLARLPEDRTILTDIWRHDRDGTVYLDLAGATRKDRRVVRDQANAVWYTYRASDLSRPLRPLDEAPDPVAKQAIGRYLEEAGVLR